MDTTEMHSWPGWETVRLIGRGSFGAVYEIERRLFEDEEPEKAALKVITIPQNDSDIEELYNDGYDEESVTSTFRSHLKSIVAEYSLMRKMNGSSNIVNCDDVRYVQHDDGIGWDIYIKMELLTPLTRALPATVSEEQVIKIAKDMCAALELCSKHNIIHRDIKPQNIFVSENGDYKLGDFGIAKTVEKTMGGTKTGTYKYMAPEVYSNKPYNSTADIYSLGLVLYWLLNERRMPFMPLPPEKLRAGMDEESRSRRFSGEQIPAPRNGSEELKRIVLKACAYDPKDRYQSARKMREDLMRLSGGQATECIPEPEPAPILDISDDTDDKKTVGPIFNHASVVDVEDLDTTVGPQFLSKEKKQDKKKNELEQRREICQKTRESHASSKKMGKILIGGICILIVLIIGCIYDNAFPQYAPIEPTEVTTAESYDEANTRLSEVLQTQATSNDRDITIVTVGDPHLGILKVAAQLLEQENYTLTIIELSDYEIPNNMVENGEADANFFQHEPYLTTFNDTYGTHLVSVAPIFYQSDAGTDYANVLVVKEGNESSEKIQALAKALCSQKVKNYIDETYAGMKALTQMSADVDNGIVRYGEPLIWGFDMTLEEFEQSAARLIESAKSWTSENAPQTLEDFPFFPASVFDVFETVVSAEEELELRDFMAIWKSELPKILPETITGMEYSRSFRYVDGNKNAWENLEFTPVGDYEFRAHIPEDVWENNSHAGYRYPYKLGLSGCIYHDEWLEILQISYPISDKQIDCASFIGLIMSNDQYSIAWYDDAQESRIEVDIYSYSNGRIWNMTYDAVSGRLVEMSK